MSSKTARALREEAADIRANEDPGYGLVDTVTANWMAKVLERIADRLDEPKHQHSKKL